MSIIKGEDTKFNSLMEEIAKKHERSKVFVDFLDYYINQHTKSTTDFHGSYDDNELNLFKKAYMEFNMLMDSLIKEYGWYDYIGEYYEAFVLAGSKASNKGQFYTPREISELLTRITSSEDNIQIRKGTAYDPACGSARNLLNYHSKHADIFLHGEDLDESACKMAVVNFHCHHVLRGQVDWIDALTREYTGTSWIIFPDRIITTNLTEIQMIQTIVGATELLAYDTNRK